ncbi:hypothetical protein D3C79_812540 [compost metagenome]
MSERAQIGAFIDIEINVQRINRDDGGQRCYAIGDIVALGNEGVTNAAADGRGDASETQVQLRSVQRCLGGVDLRFAGIA